MSDLISRKAIMSRIESEYRKYGEEYDAGQILCDIEDFPTAFDLESVKQKIVELQLSVKDKELSTTDEEFATMLRGRLRGIVDCLEIIESAANVADGKNGG